MEIKVLKKDDSRSIFKISKINPSIANSIRRYILAYVPTMAIHDVEIKRNGSALYDEVLAHRLGLVPIKTDLKSYKLWEGKKTEVPKSAQYELKMTLKAKGPCTVFASDIKSTDPKVVPAFDKMPIVKLLEGQDIELIMTARLGQGKEHVKFTPALAVYRGVPELVVTKDSNTTACLEKLSDAITKKGNNLEIKDLTNWTESYENICEQNGIEVNSSKEDFIFTIESWGQLPPREIFTRAIDVFDSKLSDFETIVKKLK
ncbi:DNA-directed RNA polymerase subunit D [Candidatus Woesearchaeota archaeon]|jgi:DNA-directed RNA polymerase subunit D|nr:DNA-directed RNA polymerase subunit D [Candidatus Woesearchaeota archaeon]MBT6044531.1 DNA-directed RNA polymerase subunit D [Candidatus Woesearchaeota archaeon]